MPSSAWLRACSRSCSRCCSCFVALVVSTVAMAMAAMASSSSLRICVAWWCALLKQASQARSKDKGVAVVEEEVVAGALGAGLWLDGLGL